MRSAINAAVRTPHAMRSSTRVDIGDLAGELLSAPGGLFGVSPGRFHDDYSSGSNPPKKLFLALQSAVDVQKRPSSRFTCLLLRSRGRRRFPPHSLPVP